jgi:diacylglycerol kinase family enzyme
MAESAPASLQEQQVVFILGPEQAGASHRVLQLQETSSGASTTYKLASTLADDVPQSWLNRYLVREPPAHLQAGPDRQAHVLVSTQSGTGLALDFYNSVLVPLLDILGIAGDKNGPKLEKTTDSKSISTFARGLDRGKSHTIILLSGDGGVIEMLNGIIRGGQQSTSVSSSSTPLVAILPLGTGNALFNSLHKPVYSTHDPEPSPLVVGLRTLLKGHRAPLPCFRASFSPGSRIITYRSTNDTAEEVSEQSASVTQLYGAIVASYGFHSQLVWESDTPEYRKHGSKRFYMVAEVLLKESHAYNATVQVLQGDGETPQTLDRSTYSYILATMVSNLERTFAISPASKPLDGKLRLVHFGAVSGEKTMEIMKQAYDGGKHVGMKWTGEDGTEQGVGYDEIRQVEITTREHDDRWRKVCIDGTIVEIPEGGSMVVRTESESHLDVLVDASVA